MLVIYTVDSNGDIVLNIKQILNRPVLAEIYKNDKTANKEVSKAYFKYLDLFTDPLEYPARNGLSTNDAHQYCWKNSGLSDTFIFPKNNKEIIRYVKNNVSINVISKTIVSSIKALELSHKVLDAYLDRMNTLFEDILSDNLTESDKRDIDTGKILTDINKTQEAIEKIPDKIRNIRRLLDDENRTLIELRGRGEYDTSMDGDDDIVELAMEDYDRKDN